jgi:mono/diheme cytochrome c family protein
MKHTIIFAALLGILLAACGMQQEHPQPTSNGAMEKTSRSLAEKTNLVQRGEYLVTGIGCGDCHTPWKMGPNGPEPDQSLLLSGHQENAPYPTWTPAEMQRGAAALVSPTNTAWAGPWGVSFTANLTPDTTTGIGEWTEETFIRAIRTGKHQGYANSRDILPPMPWPAYRNLSDEDLKAIWAYLRTLKPVKNQVPFPVPPTAPLSMAD